MALALLCPAVAAADPLDRWSNEIERASARFGIPEDWIRQVMRSESGGQTILAGRPIVSRAGAMGLMQLMPGTWRDMRVALGLGADPYDPRDNIVAGTAYLRLMYDRFGYPGLFAAYNAGPARYGDFIAGRRALPRETRAYVSAVARGHEEQGNNPLWGGRRGIFALGASTGAASAIVQRRPAPQAALFVQLAR